jgi:hypothetical protein
MSKENNETKFDKILEGYRPMPMGRMFYTPTWYLLVCRAQES